MYVQVCNKPHKVQRERYDGPAMDIDMSAMNLSVGKDAEANGKTPERSADDIHHRPPTRSGGRHMQESSFTFSGKFFCTTQNTMPEMSVQFVLTFTTLLNEQRRYYVVRHPSVALCVHLSVSAELQLHTCCISLGGKGYVLRRIQWSLVL